MRDRRYERAVTQALLTGMPTIERKLLQREVRTTAREFLAHVQATGLPMAPEDGLELAAQLSEFLVMRISGQIHRIEELRDMQVEFNLRMHRAASEQEKQDHVLDFSRRLGASRYNLVRDRRAFRRWFGYDAVLERCNRRMGQAEHDIVFLATRLGTLVSTAVAWCPDAAGAERMWGRLAVERTLTPLLAFRGDERVRTSAFRALTTAVRALPLQLRSHCLSESTLAFIYRSALDVRQPIWVQCQALEFMSTFDPDAFVQAMERRIGEPGEADDLFVRRRAVDLLRNCIGRFSELVDLIPAFLFDPSPYVRQGVSAVLAECLLHPSYHDSPDQSVALLRTLALVDTAPQVRASALREALRLVGEPALFSSVLDLLTSHLSNENDSFVLRVGLQTVAEAVEKLRVLDRSNHADALVEALTPCLQRLHVSAIDLSIRRRAAMTRERIIVASDEQARSLREHLSATLTGLSPGRGRSVSRRLLRQTDETLFGRVLAVLSQEDLGYAAERKTLSVRITRGEVMGFRFWRFFYELLSPSPDKRQGFDHTVGRVTRGSLRCPSCIGSELTQTKVPGEPLYMPSEQGWRPYLPLVDHVITALQSCLSNAPTRIFSPEGITEIKPPRSLVLRILARSRLMFGFARYAELRNWREEDRSRPDAYIAALERLGVRITYSPPMSSSAAEDVDDSVTRFFPAGLAFFGEESWQGIRDYFFSAYENSLFELGLFSAGLMALFLSGKLYLAGAGKWARRGLDLVIGGWGTRGKSGTERLKAALFEALGHGLVNKTTGCEAMFLYAYPFGRTREMFLFRPYDKATIWEHLNLMVMARRLGARVFLWECMGLNPAFVKILQRQWSQDDYSTITNTYPDHEDLQGPAGINIPEVMINFIPRKGVLVTSEEEMKPYLVSGAQDLGCRVESVNWLEAGFLTPDIMDRFPYQEHPYNIALVVALANELGIEADFALKEMADRVVPDIGVLKVFPAAQVEGRLLEFTNGMSANERFGTLSNWRRVGFDAVDVEGSPGTILTTVVNNRADRISRSRMFASILVNDISADMHVLIGSNLSGLRGYIEEAWAEYADEIRFDTSAPDPASTARTTVLAVARRLRIPTSPGHVRGRLHAILDNLEGDFDKNGIGAQWEDPAKVKEALDQAGLGSYADDIAAYLDAQVSVLRQFTDIDQRIAAASASELTRLQATFRELAHQWFTAKLLVIEDYYATGDEIVHRITKATPPGLLNRVMGLQNIKGTGLDFVYRWQAWETCFEACSLMLSENDAAKFEAGLDKLSTFQEFGLLSFEHVRDTLAQVRAKPAAQTERVQAALALIEGRLTEAVNSIRGEIGVSQTRSGVLHRIVEVVEAFLDAGDAVRRRKQADRIYRDLIDERISHERAAYELKKLNSRQKGGWLAARLGMQ